MTDATFFAPGRVNLIGEHLDYNGGRCLPIALSVGTTVTVAVRRDRRVRIRSRQREGAFEGDLHRLREAPGWTAYAAGVLWALQDDGMALPGLDLELDSNVPLGAGLSSSAALTCSVALAGLHAAGEPADSDQVIRAARRAETEVAGAPTGGLDQTICVRAEQDHALLIDFALDEHRPVPWSPQAQLLVVDTRVTHALNDGRYGERRDQCRQAAAVIGVRHLAQATSWDALEGVLLRRARHVLTEMQRVEQVLTGDLDAVGAAFTASHESLRDDFAVSCPELDVVVESALGAGSLGARMTGGGFGGSAIALVPADRADAVRAAVQDAFARRGWAAPGFLDGTASAGARRLEAGWALRG